MDFLTSPTLIAGLAAGAFAPLVLLYFLKLRRTPVVVPSTMLWRRAVEDLTVNAPFQRLRRNILLFLQLLLLVLLLLALAQPRLFNVAMGQSRNVVLLIDHSASMTASDVEPSRLAQAKSLAEAYLDTLNASDRVMLISFASTARVLVPYTTQHDRVRDELRRIEPTLTAGRLGEAMQLAEAFGEMGTAQVQDLVQVPDNPAQWPTVVLFSDGRVEDLREIDASRSQLDFRRVGTLATAPEPPRNVGVTAMEARRDYERPERVSAFARLENFGPAAVAGDLVLYRQRLLAIETGGRTQFEPQPEDIVQVVTLEVPGVQNANQGNAAGVSPFETAQPGVRNVSFRPFDENAGALLRVAFRHADGPDHLAADDQAFKTLPPPKLTSVLVVTDGNYFLMRAMRVLPVERVDQMSTTEWTRTGAPLREGSSEKLHDVIVFDRMNVPTDALPPGGYLMLGGIPLMPGLELLGGSAEGESIVDSDVSHPALRHVDMTNVVAMSWPKMRLPRSARVLARGESNESYPMFEVSQNARQFVVVPFDLLESNWPLRVSFPVFCYNAIRYLGNTVGVTERPIVAGSAVVLPLKLDGPLTDATRTELSVVRPDGTRDEIVAQGRAEATFGATEQLGFYEVNGPVAGLPRFAVNLFSRNESDVRAAEGITVSTGETIAGDSVVAPANIDLWPYLVLAAIALVLLEWWIYNRRVII